MPPQPNRLLEVTEPPRPVPGKIDEQGHDALRTRTRQDHADGIGIEHVPDDRRGAAIGDPTSTITAASQTEDLMAVTDEFPHGRWSEDAARTGDEHPHRTLLRAHVWQARREVPTSVPTRAS